MGSFGRLARRALETEMPVMVQIQEVIRGSKDAMSLAQEVLYNEVEQGDVYGNELIEYEEEGAEMRKGLLEQVTYAGVEPADADPVQVATDDEIDFSFFDDDLSED